MFLGLAPIVGVLISAAVSVASSYLISALNRPKQDEPEGRVPGSAIGRNIPEGFNVFVIDDVRWIEPATDGRMFVPRSSGQKLYFTGVGAIASCEGGCQIEKLWVAGQKEFDNGGDTNFIDREIDFNQGLSTQNPVEWQTSNWGSERPATDYVAYLNIATIGFYSLGVHKRGFSAPALKIVLKGNTTYTVGDICRKKAIDAGINQANIDITEVATEACRGFTCDRNGNSYYQQLEPLLVNHFIGIVEQPNGNLKFKRIARDNVILDIPLEHLGTRKEGEDLNYLISRSFTDTRDLPRSLILNFIDSGELNLSDFEQASVESDFHPQAVSTHIENISTEELLSRPEAKVIANKLLYQIWSRAITYEFTIPYDYKALIEPLDVVTIDNGTYTIQIDSMTLTSDFRVKVKAYEYKPASISYATSGANAIATPVSTTPVSDPPDATEQTAIANGEITLLDCPIINNEDTELGVYAFANYAGDIYLSRDNEATYTLVTTVDVATYGTCQSILGFENTTINSNTYSVNTNLSSGSLPILDNTNTLQVTLTNGSIPSLTQSQFDNEEILLFVGKQTNGIWEGELICANIAVDVGGTVTLSELKRGLRGTEYYIDKHTSGESVFLINSNTPRIALTQSDINTQLFYKIEISDIQDFDSITAKSFNFTGQGINSYSPTDLVYTEDELGDITFSLSSRSRLGQLQTGEQNSFELDLLDPGDIVVRTITGTSSNLKYTQADQTTDGLTSPFKINGYKINSVNGRGFPSYFREIQVGGSIPYIPLTDSIYRGIKTIDSATTTNYTLTESDRGLLIKFDTTTADIDLTLPDTLDVGFYCTVRNSDNGSTNNLNLFDINTDPILDEVLTTGQKINLVNDQSNTWVKFESSISESTNSGGSGEFLDISVTSAFLTDGASENIDLDMAAVSSIRSITVDKESRIRLFGTDSDRTADTADVNTQLSDQSGLILDKLFSTGSLTYNFAKGVIAHNLDSQIANTLYVKIFNNSGSSGTVQLDISYYAIAKIKL